MDKKIKVAVIFGGKSTEHEVSRVSAASVVRNIDKEKYDVVTIGITKEGRWLPYSGSADLIENGKWEAEARKSLAGGGARSSKLLPGKFHRKDDTSKGVETRALLEIAGAEANDEKIDVVFPALHGCNGEDGTIQGFLELADVPYVGAGVLGSALGMDKAYARVILEKVGIPQARYLLLLRKEVRENWEKTIEEVENNFSYPFFIKPSNSGSSVGVTKAHDRKEFEEGLKVAMKYDRKILVEEFIDGREIECAVLGNDKPQASTVGEIVPSNEFYDYDAKYKSDDSKLIIPAELPFGTIQEIREYAIKAFKALDCAGLARVDFFVHRDTGKIYINEINTIPGFTPISMYPKLWEASGVPYSELIDRLIMLAIEKYNDNQRHL